MAKKVVFKKELLDPATGEVITAIAYIPQPKDEEFCKVYRLWGDEIVKDLANRVISGGEAKILLWFLAETTKLPPQSEMWIPVKYEELAEKVQLNKDVVQKYVKQLVKKGYLEQFSQRHTTFRLRPAYVYKGVLAKIQDVDF